MRIIRKFGFALLGLSAILTLTFTFNRCGPGTAEGNMGSLGVFLQLKALSENGSLQSQDGFELNLQDFEIQILGITLINEFFDQTAEGNFLAEVSEGSNEILEIEELPGVDYENVHLLLGHSGAENLNFSVKHSEEEEEHHEGEEEHGHEEEHSLFIELEATQNGESCTILLEGELPQLQIEVNMEGQTLSVERDNEATLLLLFDQESFFQNLKVGEDCHEGQTLHRELSPELLEALQNSFELGEASDGAPEESEDGGHGHGHG